MKKFTILYLAEPTGINMQLPALVRSADSEHKRFFIFISIISPLHHDHPGALQAGSLHLYLAITCQQSVLQVFPPRSYKTSTQTSAACRHCPDYQTCRHCPDSLPSSLRWETGTASFEAISGIRCRAFESPFSSLFVCLNAGLHSNKQTARSL